MPRNASGIAAFLGSVARNRRGFKFGPAERVQEGGLAAVVPILRKTSLVRQYVTFPEALAFTAVKDTGSIHVFTVHNTGAANVLIRAGTIFKGATQERVLVRSAVVFPGKPATVEVRCVHQTRGISPGAETTYGGVSPKEVDMGTYTVGFKPADQTKYWQEVQTYSSTIVGTVPGQAAMMYAAPVHGEREVKTKGSILAPAAQILRARGVRGQSVWSGQPGYGGTKADDLHSNVEAFAANIDEVLKRVKRMPNQVGLGVITEKGCETIELYDVPASWEAFHGDAVKRVGQDLSRKGDNVFDYKPEYATNTVAAVLADTYAENVILDHRPSNGEPAVRVVGLTGGRFIGEVVEIDGRVAHVVLNRTAA